MCTYFAIFLFTGLIPVYLSPTPMMLQMKFDFDQLADLIDIHVWKFGR